MVNKLKYPALNAKMKGMHSNHLNKEELEDLLRQNSLKDAIYFLKSKFPTLENIDETTHRKELEQELNNLFIIDILKLTKYLNKQETEIFMEFLSKYEINCVKNVFRNVTTNRDAKINLKNIDNWTTKIFKPIDGINAITEEKEFLEIIKSEEYYKVFSKYENIIEYVPLEQIEVELDKFYFNETYNLSKKVNKEFQNIIGTEIDLLNAIWIYRARKYFEYSQDEVLNILIPINYRLSKEKTIRLANANDFEEMQMILNETIYKNVFKDEKFIEHNKNQYLYKKYIKLFRTELFNICTVFCNINLIDIEIKNIINIIEGIRYKLDKQEIQKRIII